jgi:cytochrome bd ubiquinol oxidase subunit II
MSFIWFVLVLLCALMYVVLDGYDLGIGVATLLERDAGRRRQMLEQVAQAWDGNETWLVLLGVSVWAGFPLAFGTILPHAYLPLIVMLFSLIVRGASVEMASQRPPAPGWETAFGVASLTASLAQGVAAGTLAQTLTFKGGAYTGSAFGSISWFSALTAVTVTCGYLALGYAHTRRKATGQLRASAGRRGTVSAAAAAVLAAACLAAAGATAAPLNLNSPGRSAGFPRLLLFSAGGVVALAVVAARYPVLAPPGLTVTAAAAPGTTMAFLAVGVGLNVPLILYYTWFAHHAFRGKQHSIPEGRDMPRAQPGAIHDH